MMVDYHCAKGVGDVSECVLVKWGCIKIAVAWQAKAQARSSHKGHMNFNSTIYRTEPRKYARPWPSLTLSSYNRWRRIMHSWAFLTHALFPPALSRVRSRQIYRGRARYFPTSLNPSPSHALRFLFVSACWPFFAIWSHASIRPCLCPLTIQSRTLSMSWWSITHSSGLDRTYEATESIW